MSNKVIGKSERTRRKINCTPCSFRKLFLGFVIRIYELFIKSETVISNHGNKFRRKFIT